MLRNFSQCSERKSTFERKRKSSCTENFRSNFHSNHRDDYQVSARERTTAKKTIVEFRLLDEDSQWKDVSLKTLEKLTLTLIDAITKRDPSGNRLWPFRSTNPWILLYRVTIK